MRAVLYAFVALFALIGASQAQAQLSFQLSTGDASGNQSMPLDSNNCANEGPRAMYVGGVLKNNGLVAVTNINATMSGLGGNFYLAGGQPATQSLGTLGAGQSTGLYWFVGYGCSYNASLQPTITVTSSGATLSPSVTLTARSAISANAGGQVTGATLGPGAVVGQTISFDATYSFGGASTGDEYFLQPAGGQIFNAACFRLVGSEIVSSGVTAVPTANSDNRLYFTAGTRQSGSGFQARVRYFFEYQCAGASTVARPYAVQTSGSSNIKYTGNFDGGDALVINFPTATNPFTIAKSSDTTSALAGLPQVVRYTVTVTNPSAFASRISQITDTLPAGATFAGLDLLSNVTAVNSSSVPSLGASGTLNFVGKQDQSYLIPAGGNVKLIYLVTMPAAVGSYTNTAQARFGSATTPVVSATFSVVAPAPLTVVKSSQANHDPINGSSNPKLIPGGRAAYTISVSNPNNFTVTANSIVITDPTPAGLHLRVADINGSGSGPVLFENGSPSSGLTYAYAGPASTTDDVEFSNNNGASWTYQPVANGSGTDPAVTAVRIRPKGTMAANSSFSLRLLYQIN
ncbi:MAG TPA: hypothetical protein VGB70_10830 [Allosphingosinicella sp.]|jgi:uncharacterized repeat protein (TIGR01451 family)